MRQDIPRIEAIDAIDYRVEPRSWRFTIDEAEAIDRHWDKLSAGNPHLFNGRVFLMHRMAIELQDDRRVLRGDGFEVEYKAFLAWRDFGFPDPETANCFAMAALLSADGAFMLGRMGGHTANPGRIYFPAGTPDLDDVKEDLIDLEGSVLRELAEETGIAPNEVAVEPGWTVVFEGPRVACMKIVRSSLSAAEIQARFEAFIAAEASPELDALLAVFSERDFDKERMPDFTLRYLRHALAGR
ncbi:NUDIX hydrolase [Methylocapsa acidiphila]|uniref:NUDIX hydrolase n=1 Tax=Methylocapsa acidiphila TaxID=133552 RepID=UPI0003F8C0AD|nr:NUDIX hydrolase [Methylocapsa acidiphila]